ncbi:MAG: hypothetical protein JNG89_05530 [Planctomycetaceae bacterium]|nr:hypothetical protein [Planctomycetaceae bacterium]
MKDVPHTTPAGSRQARGWPTPRSAAMFLLALILLLAASPLLEEFAAGELLESLLLTLVLVAAIPAVGGTRRHLITATVFALPAILGKWLHHCLPDDFPHQWFLIPAVAFCAYVIEKHLQFILRSKVVDAQVLCAGVSTFLMLGLLWTFGFLLLNQFSPGAVYFSFATLSGAYCPEITVVSNFARMLAVCEGMAAMFYVAILIARRVALYSERSGSE